jgi:hypothetical protein
MGVELYGDQSHPSAIVIRSNAAVAGIEFYSPPDFSQQIGLMTRPTGHVVPAHVHNIIERTISHTQEVLVIRKGLCKVTLYDSKLEVTNEIILSGGDTILLASGGHQIEMLEDTEILEVKQGPYAGAHDKTHLDLKN